MKKRRFDIGGRRLFSRDPLQQIAVGYFQQCFILSDLVRVQAREALIRETSEDQVHLTHSAMPRAETGAAAARVEVALVSVLHVNSRGRGGYTVEHCACQPCAGVFRP